MSEHKANHKKLGTKLLSLTLSAAMVISMFPTAIASAAEEPQEPQTPSITTTTTVKSFSKLEKPFTEVPAQESTYALSVKLGTPYEDLKLPEKLEVKAEEVKDSDGVQYSKETKTEKIAVTWDGDKEYNPDENGQFVYTAALPAGYGLADGLELPRIYVSVGKLARDASGTYEVTSAEELKNAFSSALEGNIIKVTAGIDLSTTGVSLKGSKAVTLNLNGFEVKYGGTTGAAITLENGAGLTVTDDTPTAQGKLSASGESARAIHNKGTGAVIVSGGTVSSTSGSAIYNSGTGTVTVSGGTVSATSGNAIYNNGTGAVTVSGGTAQATSGKAIYNVNTGAVNVSSGTVSSTTTSTAIYNSGTGAITVSGGTVSAASGNAIYNNSTGAVTVSGGTVEATTGSAILNNAAGAVTVSGGTVSATTGRTISNVSTGAITVSGNATVTSANTSESEGTIYLAKVPGSVSVVLTIEDTASVTNTAETGGKYAIYFPTTSSVTAETVADYLAVTTSGTVGNIFPAPTITGVAAIGFTGYDTLQKAFEAAQDGQTVKVLENIDLNTTSVNLNAEKTVTLDLNGFEVKYGGTGYAIALGNGASLTVTDGTGQKKGKLSATGSGSRAIYNNSSGAVTISDGSISCTNGYVILSDNEGTVTVSGGSITADSGLAISNSNTGTVTVNGGSVSTNIGYAISNSGTGTVTVSGGAVSSAAGYAISNSSTGLITVSGGTVSTTAGYAICNKGTGLITVSGNAVVTSQKINGDQGTIQLMKVPTSDPKQVLKIEGTASVTNTAEIGPKYAVYFGGFTGVTAETVADYLSLDGGTVGNIYPSPKITGVASIGLKGYDTLQKALSALKSGQTVKVLENIDLGLGAIGVTIEGEKTVTLDLNGFEVTYGGTGGAIVLTQGGTGLTVTDGTSEKKGKLSATGNGSMAIHSIFGGDITVSGGTVSAADGHAIYFKTNDGLLTISGDAVVTSKNSKEIEGTIYFTKVPSSDPKQILKIEGTASVTNTAETGPKYAVYFKDSSVTAESVADYLTLDGGTIGSIFPEPKITGVASIGIRGYDTLQKAFDAAKGGQTVKVLENINLGETGVTIKGEKTVTLDLNGFEVTYGGKGSEIGLNGGASLTVTDGTSEKKGNLLSTLPGAPAISNESTGTVTVEGGSVSATNAHTIYNKSTGAVTVNGGSVSPIGTGSAIFNKDVGTVTVSGGMVSATGTNAIFNWSSGIIAISGDAVVTSQDTNGTSGTIYFSKVPTSDPKQVLKIEGTAEVTNTAGSGPKYAVYFVDGSVTADNVGDYYTKAKTATVGKIYPEKKAPSGGGGSSSSDDTPAPKPAPDKGIVVDDNSGAKDILDTTKPTATVDVKIYSGTSNSDIVPDAKIFTDIKASGKTVVMPVKDANNNELYSITINGDWMKNAPVQVNSMNFGAAVTKTAQGTEFSMRHTGFVPGGMVKVGLPGFTAGTQQYVYEIDAATGARVEITLTAADASGKVNFYAADGGKYVVTSTRDTARYGAVSDTRAPVGVAKGGSYTFKFTVENGQEAKFSVGNSRFTNTALRKVGSSYYLTVTPNGTANTGDMTGIYCTLSDGKAVKMGTAVAK